MVGRLIRFFTENWALKLAAVALAVLLWLAVEANTPRRAVFDDVPVEVDVQDPNWRLEGEPEPATARVTVTGPQGELLALASDPPRILVQVDQVNDTVESQVVPLQWIRLPPELRNTGVVGLRPDTIRLRFEELASKSLPVQVRTEGDLPQGLSLSIPIQTSPAAVEVRGPARALEELDSIALFPVDLSGLRSNTNVPTTVDSTALAAGVRVTPRQVNVVLRVVPTDSQPGLRPDSARPAGASG